MEIHERIKLLREAKGLSQSDMATNLKIATQNYWKIEKGKTELTVSRFNQIADVLGVSLLELMTGEPPKGEDIEKVKELEKRVKELEEIIKDKNKVIEAVEEKYSKLYSIVEQSISVEITAAIYAHDLGKVKVKSLSNGENSIVSHEEYRQGVKDGRFEHMRSSRDILLTDDELLSVFKSVIEGERDLIKTRLLIGGFLDKSIYAGQIKKFINIAMKMNLFEWQDMGDGDDGFWLWIGGGDKRSWNL